MLVGFASTLPWGLGILTRGKIGCNDVPLPFEDMRQDLLSHVALSMCDPPPLWGIFYQLEKVIDQYVMQAWKNLPPPPITKLVSLPLDGPLEYIPIWDFFLKIIVPKEGVCIL
jgi:hypothetical protein